MNKFLKNRPRAVLSYLTIMSTSFKNGTVYRVEYMGSLMNLVIMVIMNVTVWFSLYHFGNIKGTEQFRMLITYIMLSVLMQILFVMDETFLEMKIRDGNILHCLLKPIGLRVYLFFYNLGKFFFNLILLFLPALLFLAIFFPFTPPATITACMLFIVTLVLAYLILYTLNFLVWIISFEHMVSWGLVTFKNACILVLSGAVVPVWIMPDDLQPIVRVLPFQYIYYFPISVYLGHVPVAELSMGISLQCMWIIIFFVCGLLLWKWSLKHLVIQGG